MRTVALLFVMLAMETLPAAADVTTYGITLGEGTSCAQAVLVGGADATELQRERYIVTSVTGVTSVNGGYYLYDSDELQPPSSEIHGGFTRTVALGTTFAPNSVIAIHYYMSSPSLPPGGSGHFFVLYSCPNQNPIYTCNGPQGDCPNRPRRGARTRQDRRRNFASQLRHADFGTEGQGVGGAARAGF